MSLDTTSVRMPTSSALGALVPSRQNGERFPQPRAPGHPDTGARERIVHDETGSIMPDKSPQRPAGKKAGKTLKEKREAKREKQQTKRTIPT